jgi:uncharacterized membrane protein YgaE (UPF0421/DUF939 family)
MKIINKLFLAVKASGLHDVSFLLYLIKALAGLSICYFLYKIFPGYQFQWSMISVLLVLTPNDSDSNRLAIDRTKANIVGSSFGLLFYLIHKPNLAILAAAVTCTIIFSAVIRLGNASRTALAALIIVMVLERENDTFTFALERMLCVFTGCLIALVLTFLFGPVTKRLKQKVSDPSTESEQD